MCPVFHTVASLLECAQGSNHGQIMPASCWKKDAHISVYNWWRTHKTDLKAGISRSSQLQPVHMSQIQMQTLKRCWETCVISAMVRFKWHDLPPFQIALGLTPLHMSWWVFYFCTKKSLDNFYGVFTKVICCPRAIPPVWSLGPSRVQNFAHKIQMKICVVWIRNAGT